MLESAVYDGPEYLRLEQEVPESGRVDGHVGAFDFFLSGRGAPLGRPVGACAGPVGPGVSARSGLLLLVVKELGVDLGHNGVVSAKCKGRIFTAYYYREILISGSL